MQNKIVIVDDDYGVQDVAKLIFERAGFVTIVLDDPNELYKSLHTDANLIILDKQLAGYDGFEVCKELKQLPQFAKIPMLVMSATSGIPDIMNESHADGFIEKPFNKKHLLERIDQLLL